MNQRIFRKKSLERLVSPDSLDDYIKVSGPSVWVVSAALFLLLILAVLWCCFGRIPVTATGTGIRLEAGTFCFIKASDGAAVKPGMQVRLTVSGKERTVSGTVERIGDPVTAKAAGAAAGAGWLSMPDDWVCPVTVRISGEAPPKGSACEVSVILGRRRPLELLFGRSAV